MKLKYQNSALVELQQLADKDKHSLIISGPSGSGKSFLAEKFAEYKNVSVFHKCSSKVQNLKNLIEDSYKLSANQVICIENLDKGSSAASQVILKYLEEPLPNVYVIITCTNISMIPSTIYSRSIDVNVNNPTASDLYLFAKNLNENKLEKIKNFNIFHLVKNLDEVKYVLNLDDEKLRYFDKLYDNTFWNQPIDQIVWNLGHFEDNSKCNLKLSLRTCYEYEYDLDIKNILLQALLDIEQSRLSEVAILSKLVINIKDLK